MAEGSGTLPDSLNTPRIGLIAHDLTRSGFRFQLAPSEPLTRR